MQSVIEIIAKERGASQAEMLQLHAMEVSELESKGKNIAQTSGGPGRGIYQYEKTSDGGSGAARDALVRYKRFYSDKAYGGVMPERFQQELTGIDHENPDFTKLSPELQTEIFYADKEQKGGFPLDKLGTPEFTLKDAWLKSHWAGADADMPSKANYYDKTIQNFMMQENERRDEMIYQNAKKQASKMVNWTIQNTMEDLGQVFIAHPDKLIDEYGGEK